MQDVAPEKFDLTKYVGADTETDGLDTQRCKAFCIGFANTKGQRTFIDFRENNPEHNSIAQTILLNCRCIFHNAKFDVKVLENAGFSVPEFEDSQTLAFLNNEYEDSFKLEYLANKYLGIGKYTNDDFEEWKKKNSKVIEKSGYVTLKSEILIPYTLLDAELALTLFAGIYKKFQDFEPDTLKQYEIEKDVIKVLIRIERAGVQIDVNKAFDNMSKLEKTSKTLEKVFQEGYKVANPNSWQQIKKRYESIGISLESTDKKTMLKLAGQGDQFAKDLLRIRQTNKILSGFLLPMLENTDRITRRLHTNFNTTVAKTARLSSSNPVNFQNLPRAVEDPHDIRNYVRESIIARPGFYLLGGDYDQEEMRILADQSSCQTLIDLFNGGARDVYIEIAKLIWPMEEIDKQLRYVAKQSTLGISFGMGAARFVSQAAQYGFNIEFEEAREVIKIVKERFPEVNDMLQGLSSEVKQNGFVIDRFGKRYHVDQDKAYKAFNAVIQGTAAQVMKRSLLVLSRHVNEHFRIINTVHDEVLCEIHESIPVEQGWSIIKNSMEAISANFKLQIKMSPKFFDGNWAHTKKA